MAAHLTAKENYLRTLRGEVPEYVPTYTFGPMPGDTKPVANCMLEPAFLCDFRMKGGGKDIWGVNYVGSREAGGAVLPEPGNFILDDITKWRDVIKAPSLDDIDFEMMAKKQLDGFAAMGSPREESAVSFNLHVGYFQNLMAFMGFENGLCAMYEEPDEVMDLFDYICTFYCTVAEKMIDYVNPDVQTMMDDVAAWRNPFISEPMFKELVLPFHERQAKFGRDRGLPITMHCCGRGEDFVDDWRSIGVTAWDPAQTSNNLKAVKERCGNSFVIMGGWDTRGRLEEPDVTEEEIRQSVRDAIDAYAPGGGFAWCGAYLGAVDDTEMMRKNAIVFDEVEVYGHQFYK